MKALIIEDEEHITSLLERNLKRNGFRYIDIAHVGEDGLQFGLTYEYDVILLDINLPDKCGFDILKTLRDKKIQTPLLMLSARADTLDKIKGLNTGADDYLTKPFDREELSARITAITRRGESQISESIYKISNLEFNPRMHTLSSETKLLNLPLKEAQILECLVKKKQAPLSAEWLIDNVWGFEDDVTASTVQQHISRLRKKIKTLDSKIHIQVIRKSGYLLKVYNDD
jgi:DNA-binding response OmpR family regulator